MRRHVSGSHPSHRLWNNGCGDLSNIGTEGAQRIRCGRYGIGAKQLAVERDTRLWGDIVERSGVQIFADCVPK